VGDGEDIMGRALDAALGFATSGDTVLLAPAAASMDQFNDYADRGQKFSAAVRKHFGVNDET
jgi:UDP-N-acetylmuramoylalanine--D-glutamate ligase